MENNDKELLCQSCFMAGIHNIHFECHKVCNRCIFTSFFNKMIRSDEDYNITNGLLQYYWHYNNKITKGSMTNMMVSLRDDNYIDNNKKDFENIKKLKINCFCLQDVMGENSEETKKLLSEFLNACYPQPAPWEN